MNMLVNALISALVIFVIAYIADFFASKTSIGFPKNIIWIVAFIVWILVVLGRISLPI